MVHVTWPDSQCAEHGCLVYAGGSSWLCTERQQFSAPDGDWESQLQLHLYSISQGTWAHLQWQGDSEIPAARGFSSLTAYQNQSGENALFLAGGLPLQDDESEVWELVISSGFLLSNTILPQHVEVHAFI